MTVTNAATTFAREPGTGTKSPTLDLGLDLIVLLKRQGNFSVKNIVSRSSSCGWLERSPRDGEQWLRTPAQDDALYAMEKLGRRLLIGYDLPNLLKREYSAISTQHNTYPTSSPDSVSSQPASKTLGSLNPSSRTKGV